MFQVCVEEEAWVGALKKLGAGDLIQAVGIQCCSSLQVHTLAEWCMDLH